MRTFTEIMSTMLLAVFSLLLITGCAQNAYTVKEGKPGAAEMASLRDIAVSGEGKDTRIVILADKPLTYTYYSLKDPARTVLDLSQTDIGTAVTPTISANSLIKKIDVVKNELTAGSLVRITVETAEDLEFAANPDPVDKTKLIVSVVSPQTGEVKTQNGADTIEEPKTAVTEVPDDKSQKPESPSPTATSSTSAVSGTEQTSAAKTVSPVGSERTFASGGKKVSAHLTVSGLAVTPDGVEIQANGPIEKFKYFSLTKPNRLIVDVFQAKCSIEAKIIPINSFGLASARVGIHPEKLRFVFDSSGSTLPAHSIVRNNNNGLKILLGSAGAKDEKPVVVPSTPSGTAAQVSSRSVSKTAASVEAIDFKVTDGYSRISVSLNQEMSFVGPSKTRDGFVLTIPECFIPKRLQRTFNTSAFVSPVQRITPYQVKVKGRQDVKILVALREDAPYSVRKEGSNVILEVKNPEPSAAPTLVSGKETRTEPVSHAKAPVPDSGNSGAVKKSAVDADFAQAPAGERRRDKKVYTGKKVTLEFSDADIRKIFQLIAEVSNKNILVGDDVSGTISIKLVNVPWDQALDVILQTKGLDKKEDGNIMIIRPAGKIATLADEELAARRAYERTLELRTKVFDINYASVGDVAAQFNTYKSERGTISIDGRTNRVIVNDVAPAIEKMVSLLRELDIPEKQVLIEARIVEASSTFTQDLGIQWGIHYRDGSASFLGINSLDSNFGGIVTNVPTSSGFQSPTTAGGAMGLSFGKLTSNIQIDLRLSAAAETGQVKIISTPKVVTLNNKAAKISQGQMIPYSTVSAEGTKTEFVEAALTLEVTPHITADGAVSMKIKASNNSAGAAAVGVAPPINKKEATTELLVQNGETTVIGGIYVDSDTNTDSGIPYLKDIPLLGWLFKSNNQKKSKSELLIFITPKIVS